MALFTIFQSINLHRQTSEKLSRQGLWRIGDACTIHHFCTRDGMQTSECARLHTFWRAIWTWHKIPHLWRGRSMAWRRATRWPQTALLPWQNNRDQHHAQEVAHIHRCRCATKPWCHSLLQTWQSSMVDLIVLCASKCQKWLLPFPAPYAPFGRRHSLYETNH